MPVQPPDPPIPPKKKGGEESELAQQLYAIEYRVYELQMMVYSMMKKKR